MDLMKGFKDIGIIFGICLMGVIALYLIIILIAIVLGLILKLELHTSFIISLFVILGITIIGGAIWLGKD